MSGKLKLTNEELDDLVKDLQRMEVTLEAKIKDLNHTVNHVEGNWKGVAANAYNNLQRQVNDDTRRLKDLLVFIKDAVKASRDGFSEQETEQLNSFKSAGDLGGNGVLDRFQVS
ncbi:WXG100 family type VII secretion target [Streptomyces niger]|uniref:WXG100 family type VII secretion target n=1 Tax=Streptomyces niger TaxID=66373 RepID=UPI00069972E4|nr:WXG100 family type VII secretion target [Streptomyces niger]